MDWVNEWTATDSDDNAESTATKAANPNSRHVVRRVVASYSVAATSGLLAVKRGSTTVLEVYVHGSIALDLDLRGNQNEAVSAVLAASGTGGQIGKVAIVGYSE